VFNSAHPDGKQLIFSSGAPSDILTLSPGHDEARPLIAQPQFSERGGDISPDGRWIAYYSDESSIFQVYVRPFPDVERGRWQISGEGGTVPTWNRSGHELFYIDGRMRLVSVPVETGQTFSFGKTTALFDIADTAVPLRNYDPAPDGSRFVVVKQQRSRETSRVVIVENRFEELRRRVPTGK
jgi:Tol biopolymer transport system component